MVLDGEDHINRGELGLHWDRHFKLLHKEFTTYKKTFLRLIDGHLKPLYKEFPRHENRFCVQCNYLGSYGAGCRGSISMGESWGCIRTGISASGGLGGGEERCTSRRNLSSRACCLAISISCSSSDSRERYSF